MIYIDSWSGYFFKWFLASICVSCAFDEQWTLNAEHWWWKISKEGKYCTMTNNSASFHCYHWFISESMALQFFDECNWKLKFWITLFLVGTSDWSVSQYWENDENSQPLSVLSSHSSYGNIIAYHIETEQEQNEIGNEM